MEFNDNVRLGDFAFNLGVLVSRDVLYGQGLVGAPGGYSGFAPEPGAKYRMHTVRWRDMIQPRFGGTWILGGEDALFANFARRNPEANSLARAASWDRNTRASLQVLFDRQTRYNVNPYARDPSFGQARDHFDARRAQVTVAFRFKFSA